MHEPAGAGHCFDVCREQPGVVQGHAKIRFTLGGQHWSFQPQAFPGRKSSSDLLSLRWWIDIQVEISARHAEMRRHLGVVVFIMDPYLAAAKAATLPGVQQN